VETKWKKEGGRNTKQKKKKKKGKKGVSYNSRWLK